METLNNIYFYRERDNFGYMSNFYKSNFNLENKTYWCTEQYIMKKKQELFDPNNNELSNNIMSAKNAAKIKQYGREVNNFNGNIWDVQRILISEECIFAKFSQNLILKQKLIETVNKNIYESTRNDKIWGIGYNVNEADNINPELYGQNLLGKTLMNVRSKLFV